MGVVLTPVELVDLFECGELASQMARQFGMSSRDTHVVEEYCIALHNAGTIDLLTLVEGGDLQGLQGTDFFMASYFFCRLLPELDATLDRMMYCVDSLVTRGGQDGAANEPNAAFREWCVRVPQRANDVIAAAHEGHELAGQFLSFALEAISDLIEARRIAVEYEGVRRQAAIAALGRIEHPNLKACSETFAVFNVLLDNGVGDSIRASMLHATMQILVSGVDVSSADANALISRLVISPGKFTIHQCARALWSCRQALTQDIVSFLLEALSHLDSANKGTVEELDLGLQALLELGYDEAAISLVTLLLSRPDDDLELEVLDSFTRKLLSGSPDILSRVAVQWLGLGVPRLCNGLAEAIKGPGLDGVPLNLKAEDLALSPTAQLFICRKAVGWFFFKPTTAASVLVSVLRFCDADTAQEVQRLLVDPLLQNYGGVREYLESLAPEDAASEAVTWALAQNEAYLDAQRSVPLLLELQPSEHHRRIEHLRISDQMREAHKQAESGSVFLGLVSRSVLLYGNRSLSFIDDGQDRLRPMELDLHSHGISYEMPRMEVVDPVGLDHTLRVFRNERMKK
ncbi:hypothetical protein [Pseudomonas chlororaphis]|uniref:hypothetical protein n=1 Tax=Pseudomonas chlororaphis TaxID=587753 RepID=UPI000F588982|nr:hypothetical protein [Pseudomonas chlororaphis]UQS87726.1 hypothetical protein M5C90_17960 [Pseudomonas chlororaphis subsp. piscium]